MTYLDINDVIEFKGEVDKKFNIKLHFHDACGGQYFSFDEPLNSQMKEFIAHYFGRKGLTVVFSEQENSFVVKQKRG